MLKHQKLIEKMTLEDKVALLYSASKNSTEGYKRANVPEMLFAGKECGVIAPIGEEGRAPTTCFPEPETLARSWDIGLSHKVAYCMGKEAESLGVSVLRAPVAAPVTEPCFESRYAALSEDPYLSGKLAAAYVRGIQENNVSACVELPSGSEEAWIDERALREIYLQPYEMAVKEGKVRAIRTSDKTVNGEAVALSKHLIRGILRGEWQYSGVVVSEGKGSGTATERLINGNDLTIGAPALFVSNVSVEISRAIRKYELYNKGLAEGSIRRADYDRALDSGTVLDPEALDAAVDRVIELARASSGKRVDGRDTVYSAYPFRHRVVFAEKAHAKVALEAAESSAVLLKNNAGVLPITGDTGVAFIGEIIKRPFSQGNNTDKIFATGGESTVMSVGKTGMNVVGCAQGYGSGESEQSRRELLDEALSVAAQAETVVVYLGTDENNFARVSEETGVRLLPEDQLELLEALRALGKKVVTVLVGTATVDMSWEELSDAILLVGISGQAGVKATLRLLSGEASPSGKLVSTVPVSVSDRGPKEREGAEFRSSVFAGYRYYDQIGEGVRYPFGFGLSYTEFRYTDVRVEEDGISFTVENIGARDGAEVAQLYVSKTNSAIPRAKKELKGFAKVFVRAGGSCRVHIPFDSKSFRFYNVRSRRWEIEGGEYKLFVGASSQDIRLELSVTLNGSSADGVYKKEDIPTYYSGDISALESDEFAKLYNGSVRNGKFYGLTKKKRAPLKLLSFVPIAVAAVIDALIILSAFVPVIFKDLYYMLSDEEKFLCVLGMAAVSGAAVIACVMFWRAVGKRKRIEAGDIELSQWDASKYAPDLDYPEDWKPISETIDLSDPDEEEDGAADIDDTVRDRKNVMYVSMETVCEEYRSYAKLRGVKVSRADARQLFAAVSATRMIFIKNADIAAARTALAALGEFLQMKCYFANVGDNVRTVEDLLKPSSASDLLSAIVDAKASSRSFCMSVLCGVEPDRMKSYFGSFIPFISNPQKKCALRLSASLVEVADGDTHATVEMTQNMWFAAILAEGASFANIDSRIADSAVCIITDIAAVSDAAALSAEAAQGEANTYYATVFEWNHRVDNLKEDFYLEENCWKAIDGIESYLAEHSDFSISNKLLNRTERFAAVYLAMGGEDDCLDRCIATTVLPAVLKTEAARSGDGGKKLSEAIEESLDSFGSKLTRNALAEFGI